MSDQRKKKKRKIEYCPDCGDKMKYWGRTFNKEVRIWSCYKCMATVSVDREGNRYVSTKATRKAIGDMMGE